jgi:DNA-binding CsgD family transcriptional regulator
VTVTDATAVPGADGSLAGMPDPRDMLTLEMSGRASSPVLVGRGEQMAALEAALTSARQGEPSAVLVGGEAGVGKTRLVREFGDAAATAGGRVLIGGCMQLGTDGLPYAPFTGMFRDLIREMGADAFAALLPARAIRELARLLPELGAPAADGDQETARSRLFEEVLSALEALARRSPVVLVVEDAHWADQSSRSLLAFLIGNQRAIRGLLVLVTYRTDELHRTHPLRPLLAGLDRIDWVQRVDVPRLARAGTGELAGRIVGRELADDVTDALYRRSQGNPLFVEALMCCDGGLTAEVPESVRDLLLDSVRRLPEETQEVLRVMGGSRGGVTGPGLLAAVAGLDDEALTRALRPAVTANVLRATDEGYAFRHELICEAVHEDLLPGEHGRLHARFAEAIDADPGLVPPGRAAIETAHHWYLAHDSARALVSAWLAGAQAGRAVWPAERMELLARVLELWDRVPDAAGRIGTDHPRVLEDAAAAAFDADEYDRAIAFATAGLKEVDPAAEPLRAALLLTRRAHAGKHRGRPRPDDFERALELVPAAADPARRAEILLLAAHCGEPATRGYADEALALARRAGDQKLEAHPLIALGMFLADPAMQAGPDSEAIGLIARGRALAERAGAHDLLRDAAVNESHLLEGAGEHELAAEAARRGVASAEARGLRRIYGGLLAINQAEPLYALGRWDEATETIGRALDLSPTPAHRVMLQVIRAQIALARGVPEAAGVAASAARAMLRDVGYEDQHQLPLAVLEIMLALAAGGPAAAVAAAGEALDRHDLSRLGPRYAWPVVTAGAEAVLAASRRAAAARDQKLRDDATALAGRLRTVAEKLEASGRLQQAHRLGFAAADGHAAFLLAAFPAARPSGRAGGSGQAGGADGPDRGTGQADGVTDGVRGGWDRAAAAWEALSEPHPLAVALLHGAEAALAGGDRDAAAQRLRRAAPAAARLGARPLGEQIAVLARRAGIELAPGDRGPAAGSRAGGEGGEPLTARELEVLRLVAAGRSNREIAAELFISPKTASVHVSNILGKLGAASRGQAAARAHALRLLEPASPPVRHVGS